MCKKEKSMCRLVIFLLVGFVGVVILTSCSKTGTTAADGTAQDTVVLEDLGNGVCLQLPSGLMWQINGSKKLPTWKEANAYVNRLQLGGFDDWRLPTPDESLALAWLLLLKKGDCPMTIKGGRWVNGSKSTGKSGHWEDYPLCGGSEFRWVKDKKASVQAVRP